MAMPCGKLDIKNSCKTNSYGYKYVMLFRAKATLCLLEEKLSQKAYRINDEFID
jgi:hypothetical protein